MWTAFPSSDYYEGSVTKIGQIMLDAWQRTSAPTYLYSIRVVTKSQAICPTASASKSTPLKVKKYLSPACFGLACLETPQNLRSSPSITMSHVSTL